ncbi:MAG: RodZ domain-containing protein [Terriglobales bacterium]
MDSFGVRLKQEREQRGITLEEISQSTKIGTRMLQALEQDHFDQLPGGIFNKGFIRAYARCLGLDEEQAIADYLAASGNLASEKGKDKKSDGPSDVSSFELLGEVESRPSDLPWGSFAILLLLVAIAFTLWGFHSRNARKNTRIPVASSGALAPEAGLSPAPTATLPRASPRGENLPPAPVPVKPAGTHPTAVPAKLSAAPPERLKPLMLHITLHADSWLSVTSDGNEVLHGSFTAPTEESIRATKEIVVKAGNVGGIGLEFNGKTLPPQGANGEVKTLTFDANGLRPTPPEPPAQQP